MKRILAVALLLCLLTTSAQALTVSEFVSGYNAAIGKGFYTAYIHDDLVQDDFLFTTGHDDRHMVILKLDRESADRVEDCRVIYVTVKHKPRVSVSTFMNNMSAALAAAYPDVPEDVRLSELVRCLCVRDGVLGYGFGDDAPTPYQSTYFGEMVYQEKTDYHTFLFRLPEEE